MSRGTSYRWLDSTKRELSNTKQEHEENAAMVREGVEDIRVKALAQESGISLIRTEASKIRDDLDGARSETGESTDRLKQSIKGTEERLRGRSPC